MLWYVLLRFYSALHDWIFILIILTKVEVFGSIANILINISSCMVPIGNRNKFERKCVTILFIARVGVNCVINEWAMD